MYIYILEHVHNNPSNSNYNGDILGLIKYYDVLMRIGRED